jgi:hypothetical protein
MWCTKLSPLFTLIARVLNRFDGIVYERGQQPRGAFEHDVSARPKLPRKSGREP